MITVEFNPPVLLKTKKEKKAEHIAIVQRDAPANAVKAIITSVSWRSLTHKTTIDKVSAAMQCIPIKRVKVEIPGTTCTLSGSSKMGPKNIPILSGKALLQLYLDVHGERSRTLWPIGVVRRFRRCLDLIFGRVCLEASAWIMGITHCPVPSVINCVRYRTVY